MLQRPTIRAIVRAMSDEEVADAAIVENLQRRDISPLEEARAFQRRLEAGLTVEELAGRLGLKQPWRITERTALLALTPEFQEALARGILSPSQATEMCRHPPQDQRALFDAIGQGRCRTYQELRAVSRQLANRRAQTELFGKEGNGDRPTAGGDRQAERSLERQVDSLIRLCQLTAEDGRPSLVGRIRPERAGHFRAELELVQTHLRRLVLELEHAEEEHKPQKAG